MGCPQCQSDEISPAGVCLICGYRVAAELSDPNTEAEEQDASGHSGLIEIDYSGGTPEDSEKNEVPPWRQQLSQRLHEIKQKKESLAAVQQESKASPAATSQAKATETLSSLQARLKKVSAHKPQGPPVPPPRQKTLQPLGPGLAPKSAAPPPPATESQEIRNLIDSAIAKQASQTGAPSGISLSPGYVPEPAPDQEGKLILLSRTLAGLVDWIVVAFCTGAFIVAADYFSGIIALDRVSLMLFCVLFLLNFFLYSLFFLAASNQTIGMMITDLRVVGADKKRPSLGQLARRCCGYFASLCFVGIGLVSALFDRGSLCFHDRISGTHVVRI
jgi:uncharacterized RDD family membrane protein YckC